MLNYRAWIWEGTVTESREQLHPADKARGPHNTWNVRNAAESTAHIKNKINNNQNGLLRLWWVLYPLRVPHLSQKWFHHIKSPLGIGMSLGSYLVRFLQVWSTSVRAKHCTWSNSPWALNITFCIAADQEAPTDPTQPAYTLCLKASRKETPDTQPQPCPAAHLKTNQFLTHLPAGAQPLTGVWHVDQAPSSVCSTYNQRGLQRKGGRKKKEHSHVCVQCTNVKHHACGWNTVPLACCAFCHCLTVPWIQRGPKCHRNKETNQISEEHRWKLISPALLFFWSREPAA